VLAGYLGSALLFAAHPQMFSVLLFAIELYLLEVARTRPRVAPCGFRSSCRYPFSEHLCVLAD
jgi:hypothetical protein